MSNEVKAAWIGAGAAVLAAVIGGFFVLASQGNDSETIVTIPNNAQGPNPFTDPVDPENPEDNLDLLPSDVSLSSGIAWTEGDPLYGGSGNDSHCDRQAIVSFLEANPERAEAWATSLGIAVEEIENYLTGLTPTILVYDQRVTNHGFRDGEAYPFQSVLQAGTAVLVDAANKPRVRCKCGNPVVEPITQEGEGTVQEIYEPSEGTEFWSDFSIDAIVSIDPDLSQLSSDDKDKDREVSGEGADLIAAYERNFAANKNQMDSMEQKVLPTAECQMKIRVETLEPDLIEAINGITDKSVDEETANGNIAWLPPLDFSVSDLESEGEIEGVNERGLAAYDRILAECYAGNLVEANVMDDAVRNFNSTGNKDPETVINDYRCRYQVAAPTNDELLANYYYWFYYGGGTGGSLADGSTRFAELSLELSNRLDDAREVCE